MSEQKAYAKLRPMENNEIAVGSVIILSFIIKGEGSIPGADVDCWSHPILVSNIQVDAWRKERPALRKFGCISVIMCIAAK